MFECCTKLCNWHHFNYKDEFDNIAMTKQLSCNLQFVLILIILVLSSTVKNNQNNSFMKNIKVGLNDFYEIISAGNNNSNKSKNVYLK